MRSNLARRDLPSLNPDRPLMADIPFSLRFPSTSRAVRSALAETCTRLKAGESGADTVGQVEIVLAEVLNNVVEHALCHEEEGEITLSVHHDDEGWRFEISDDGVAMPGGIVPHPPLPGTNRPLQDLPEGGFGWAIVNMLAHDLSYRRKAGRNHLSFVIADLG